MYPERVNSCSTTAPQTTKSFDIESFLSKIDGGVELETLILADSFFQKKAGREMRKTSRELQKKALEAAIKKMKAAASDRMWSAVVGAALDVCASIYEYSLAGADGQITDKVPKLKVGLARAGAAFFSKVNLQEMSALENDAAEKRLEQASNMEAGRAGDAKDLIQSARDLEQRMLSNIEKADQNEHQARMDLARRIGG
ncbi:MAG TPA: hypothetical protein VM425_18950 [Myxococcota bacterium]|nr:hypothetical protein [Myxococcota bacterium]